MEPSLSIVIPAFNESASLQHYLPEVVAFCRKHTFELILVNDGSADDTQATAMQHAHEPFVTVLRNKLNRGYGGAIKRGIEAAKTDYVVTIDADGQHYLEDIVSLFEAAQTADADMVVGSRKGIASSTLYRGVGKSLIRGIAKVLMPLPIYDINSGMKLYRTELAQRYIRLCPNSMAYSDTIALIFISQRHLVIEKNIRIKERITGTSTISTRTAIETVKEIVNIVVLFNPMKIFLPLSILCIVAGIAWGLPIVLAGRGISVGAMLGIITGTIFFFLGLLAEQISLMRKQSL